MWLFWMFAISSNSFVSSSFSFSIFYSPPSFLSLNPSLLFLLLSLFSFTFSSHPFFSFLSLFGNLVIFWHNPHREYLLQDLHSDSLENIYRLLVHESARNKILNNNLLLNSRRYGALPNLYKKHYCWMDKRFVHKVSTSLIFYKFTSTSALLNLTALSKKVKKSFYLR